ncbi:innexin unc-9-like isoform X2 [Physella acuta]|nr:innexin unc-9-like isoform X2 [Physella acuta]XP_059173055.1 innexin unc-9-like isoform X2 [Physella acuta]
MYGVFVSFGFTAATKQYVQEPIFCWLPFEYKDKQHKRYINYYCWTHTLYTQPFDSPMPVLEQDRYKHSISYYRWTTVFFLCLAMLYRVPKFFWKEIKHFSGINVSKIIDMTLDTVKSSQEDRDKQLGFVSEFLHRWITVYSHTSKSGKNTAGRRLAPVTAWCGKRSGRFLTLVYLLTKTMYLVNVIVQFFLISSFLGLNFWTFGYSAVSALQEGEALDDLFPRLAYCDFNLRQLANTQPFTVQCVLTMAVFLEKMFLLLWVCLWLLLVANLCSLAKWTYQLTSQTKLREAVEKYTCMFDWADSGTGALTGKELSALVRHYLRADGVFVIKMIESNTTTLLVSDLVRQIVLRYKQFVRENDVDNTSNGGLQMRREHLVLGKKDTII